MPIDRNRSHDEVAAIVREGYDTIADRYLASVRTTDTNDPRSAWVDGLLASVQPESRIIDIRCGPGVPTASSTPPGIALSASTSRPARSHSPDPSS